MIVLSTERHMEQGANVRYVNFKSMQGYQRWEKVHVKVYPSLPD
jgi:hypothetical protein